MPGQDYDLDALLAEMDETAEKVKVGLEGTFKDELRDLRALDPEIIRDITPDTTDEAVYEKMLVLVREASAKNLSQAQLVERVRELGDTAKAIASHVPRLAKLFI